MTETKIIAFVIVYFEEGTGIFKVWHTFFINGSVLSPRSVIPKTK